MNLDITEKWAKEIALMSDADFEENCKHIETLLNRRKQALRIHDVSGSALSDLAKEIYFKNVLVDKYRDNFLLELQKRKVIDKRENGFHCCYCSKISEKETAFVQMDRVIFPKNNESELWLVNSHYDGCRGWD